MAYVESLLRKELQLQSAPVCMALVALARNAGKSIYLPRLLVLWPAPSVVALSIALGAIEAAATVKNETLQMLPTDLEATVNEALGSWADWLDEAAAALASLGAGADARVKVTAVAGAVWKRLAAGSFSKDVLHAQHLYSFTLLLLPPQPPPARPPRKQLDCAGVVTAVYATCMALAERHEQHANLAGVRMQVSEDHCWIQLAAAQGATPAQLRGGAVEVTATNPAQRGQAPAPAAWAGWLYGGGAALVCTPLQALGAAVASLDPQVSSAAGAATAAAAVAPGA